MRRLGPWPRALLLALAVVCCGLLAEGLRRRRNRFHNLALQHARAGRDSDARAAQLSSLADHLVRDDSGKVLDPRKSTDLISALHESGACSREVFLDAELENLDGKRRVDWDALIARARSLAREEAGTAADHARLGRFYESRW